MALSGGDTRTLDQVKETIRQCKKQKSDVSMARALLRFGNIAREAHVWLRAEYPQHADITHQQGWTHGRERA